MSRPVDERIIRLKLENADFKNKVQDTLGTLGKLQSTVSSGLNEGLTKGINGISSTFDKITSGFKTGLERLSTSLGAGFEKVVGYLSNGLSTAMSGVGSVQQAVSGFSMGGLTGGIASAASSFGGLQGVALGALMTIGNKAVSAGIKIAKSLVLDGPKAGFKEYESKMKSIQTILMNTKGKNNLDDVKKSINELNQYADKTIYSFKDMVDNASKFTTSGMDITEATKSIKGLSNLAAAQGANAEQTSRAMYQMSQAFSTGKMQLMDWRSMENAGLGGKFFQNALKDSAKELGKAVPQGIAFRDSLKQGWVTADVLQRTLKKFAEDKSMIEAATKVRTFTQFVETSKEAVGSGWAQTWELIFGDFEEATELWSSASELVSEVIGSADGLRNGILGIFASAGLFENTFHVILNLMKSVWRVFSLVTTVIVGLIPKPALKIVKMFGDVLRWLTERLVISSATMEKVQKIFKTTGGIFELIWRVLKKVGDAFMNLLPKKLRKSIVDTITSIGKQWQKLRDAFDIIKHAKNILVNLGKWFESLRKSATKALKPLTDLIEKLVKNIVEWIGKKLLSGLKRIESGLKSVNAFIANVVKGFVNFYQKGIKPVAAFIGKTLLVVILKLIDALEWLYNHTLLPIGKYIRGTFTLAIEKMNKAWESFTNKVKMAAKPLTDRLAKAMEIVNKATKTAKESYDKFKKSLGKGIDKAAIQIEKAFSKIKTAAKYLTKPIADGFAQIKIAANNWTTAIGKNFKTFGKELGGSFKVAYAMFKSGAFSWKSIGKTLMLPFVNLYKAVIKSTGKFGKDMDKIFKNVWIKLGEGWGKAEVSLEKALKNFKKAFAYVFDPIKKYLSNIFKPFTEGWTKMKENFANLGKDLSKSLTTQFPRLSKAFGILAKASETFTKVAGEKLTEWFPKTAKAVEKLKAALDIAIQPLRDAWVRAVTKLEEKFGNITLAFKTFREAVISAFGPKWTTITERVTHLKDALGDLLNALFGPAIEAFNKILEKLKTRFDDAKASADTLRRAFSNRMLDIVNSLKDAYEKLTEKLRKLKEAIGDRLATLVEKLSDKFKTLKDKLDATRKAIDTKLSDAINKLTDKLLGTDAAGETLTQRFGTKFQSTMLKIGEIFKGLSEKASALRTALGEKLSAGLKTLNERILTPLAKALGDGLAWAILKLADMFIYLYDASVPIVTVLSDWLYKGFSKVVDGVIWVIDAINPLIEIIGGALRVAFEGFMTVMHAVAKASSGVANFIGFFLKDAFLRLQIIVGNLKIALTEMGTALKQNVSLAFATVKVWIDKAKVSIQGFADTMKIKFAAAYEVIKPLVERIQAFVKPMRDAFSAKVTKGIETVSGWIAKLKETFSPLVDGTMDAKDAFEKFRVTMDGVYESVAVKFGGMGGKISTEMNEAKSSFKGWIASAKPTIEWIKINLLDTLGNVGKSVGSALDKAGDSVRNFFYLFAGKKASRAADMGDGFTKMATDSESAFSKFSKAVKGIAQAIKNVVQAVRDFSFKDMFASFKAGRTADVEKLSASFGKIGTSLSKVKESFKPVKEFFAKIGAWIKTGWNDLKALIAQIDIDKLLDTAFKTSGILMNFSLGRLLSGFGGFFGKLRQIIPKNSKELTNIFKTFSPKAFFEGLKKMKEAPKADQILKLAGALIVFAGALWLLHKIPLNELGQSMGALGLGLGAMMGFVIALAKTDMEKANAKKMTAMFLGLIGVILVMTSAAMKMSKIPTYAVGPAMGGIVLMMMGITSAIFALSKMEAPKIGGKAMVAMMLGLSLSLSLMVGAVSKMAAIGDPKAMLTAVGSVGILLVTLATAVTTLNYASNKMGKMDSKGVMTSMLTMALVISVVANSVIKMAAIDPDKLIWGMMAVGLIVGAMALAFAKLGATKLPNLDSMRAFTKFVRGLAVAAVSLVIFSAGLYLFIGALKLLGVIPMDIIEAGLIRLFGVLLLLSGFFYSMKASNPLGTAAALAVVALAIGLLAGNIVIFAAIPWNTFITGLTYLAAVLFVIGFAMKALEKNLGGAVSIAIAAAALMLLAGPFMLLAQLPLGKVITGLIAIGGALAIMNNSMKGADKNIKGAIGLIAMSIALNALVVPLLALQVLDIGEAIAIVLTLAGVLMTLSVTGDLIGKSVVNMLKASGAIAVFAIALTLLVPALAALSLLPIGGMIASMLMLVGMLFGLAAVGSMIGAFILPLMKLAGVIFVLGAAFGGAIGAVGIGLFALGAGLAYFATGVSQLSFVDMNKAFGSLLLLGLGLAAIAFGANLLYAALPAIITLGIATLAMGAAVLLAGIGLAYLTEHLALFAAAAVEALVIFLRAVALAMPQIFKLGFAILIEFINGCIMAIPWLIQGAIYIIYNFINGLSDAIQRDGAMLIKAVLRLLGEILILVFTSLIDIARAFLGWIPGMNQLMDGAGKKIGDTLRTAFNGQEIGGGMGEDTAVGLLETTPLLLDTGQFMSEATVAGFEGKGDPYYDMGRNAGTEVGAGVKSKSGEVGGIAGMMGGDFLKQFQTNNFAGTGGFSMDEMLGGMSGKQGGFGDMGNLLGGATVGGFKDMIPEGILASNDMSGSLTGGMDGLNVEGFDIGEGFGDSTAEGLLSKLPKGADASGQFSDILTGGLGETGKKAKKKGEDVPYKFAEGVDKTSIYAALRVGGMTDEAMAALDLDQAEHKGFEFNKKFGDGIDASEEFVIGEIHDLNESQMAALGLFPATEAGREQQEKFGAGLSDSQKWLVGIQQGISEDILYAMGYYPPVGPGEELGNRLGKDLSSHDQYAIGAAANISSDILARFGMFPATKAGRQKVIEFGDGMTEAEKWALADAYDIPMWLRDAWGLYPLKTIAENKIKDANSGMIQEGPKVVATAANIAKDGKQAFDNVNYKPSGVKDGEQVTQGLSSKRDAFRRANSELAIDGRTSFQSIKTFASGVQYTNGFINGANSRKSELRAAARGLASSALTSMRARLDEHSPSRETGKSGKNFVLGFVNNVKAMYGLVSKTSGTMATRALRSMNAFLDEFLPDMLDGNEYEVKLKPVMDFDGLGKFPDQKVNLAPNLELSKNQAASVNLGQGQNGQLISTLNKIEAERNSNGHANTDHHLTEDINVNIAITGGDQLMQDQGFTDKIKSIILKEISTGNRSIPNRTSLIPL